MKEVILKALGSGGELTAQAIILRQLAASVIACFIFLSYRLSHDGSIYSKKFNVSLVMLTIITTTVMIVIGNNIALSLGMVGALSIVRFRTAIKDSRDTVYIFWAIVVGICCGAGDYPVAAIGSIFAFVLLLLFGRIKNDGRVLIIIRAARVDEERLEAVIFNRYMHKATMRVKNTTKDSIELIYEISKKVLDKADKHGSMISDEIYAAGSVEYFNIVMQNDDISS